MLESTASSGDKYSIAKYCMHQTQVTWVRKLCLLCCVVYVDDSHVVVVVVVVVVEGSLAVRDAFYGSGVGPILLDNVFCSGSESNLLQCNHQPLFSTDCNHSEDAGVKCEGILNSHLTFLRF